MNDENPAVCKDETPTLKRCCAEGKPELYDICVVTPLRPWGTPSIMSHGSSSLLKSCILSSLNAATHKQRSKTPSTAGKFNLELASMRRSRLLTIVAVVRYRSKLMRGSRSRAPAIRAGFCALYLRSWIYSPAKELLAKGNSFFLNLNRRTDKWNTALSKVGCFHLNPQIMKVPERLNQSLHILEKGSFGRMDQLPSLLQP